MVIETEFKGMRKIWLIAVMVDGRDIETIPIKYKKDVRNEIDRLTSPVAPMARVVKSKKG